MFVIVSTLISVAILGLMFFYAKQRESTLQRKYELLIDLRQLLYLSRQHRSATHHVLMFGEKREAEIAHLQDLIHDKSSHLIVTSHMDSKPMYRVLQLKLKALMNNWQERNVARNQMMHGKAIRHCMFLMDEVMLAWLVEANREDLSEEYHMNWQQIIDSMDTLTQLRISIEGMDTQDGGARLRHYCDLLRRKLNQLALISPLSIASPACSKAMHTLTEMHENPAFEISPEKLYQLSSDVSLSIAHVYDQMLTDMAESLYIPLPKLIAI